MEAVLEEAGVDAGVWSVSVGVDNAIRLLPIQFIGDLQRVS